MVAGSREITATLTWRSSSSMGCSPTPQAFTLLREKRFDLLLRKRAERRGGSFADLLVFSEFVRIDHRATSEEPRTQSVQYPFGQPCAIGVCHKLEREDNMHENGIKTSALSFAIACALAFVADAAHAQGPASSNDPFAAFADSLTAVPAASTLNN
jgi:hypothetical protein